MTLHKSQFKQITLEDKQILKDFLKRYPQVHSECSFTNMVCWSHYAIYSYTIVDDHLLLACTIDGETYFRSPIGEFDPELFEEVICLAKREGGKIPLTFFNDFDAKYMKDTYPETPVYTNRGFAEYYYKTDELAELYGRKYVNIRGQINKFKSSYEYRVEPISLETISEIEKMVECWSVSKRCEANIIMLQEVMAVQFALKHWSELELEGLLIRISDGSIAAIAIWEELNPSTALIHFEKGFTKYEGVYKVINQETAKYLQGKYIWINRESDLNIPGLREAKLRYHPDHCAKMRYIKKKEIVISDDFDSECQAVLE